MRSSKMLAWGVVGLTTMAVWALSGETRLAAQAAKAAGVNRQAEAGQFPGRAFTRLNFDKLKWNPTEGNKLGVQTAVLEGDPSKPGFYLTINHFPPGVMSRPHTHPDERNCVVLKGTWYTGEGREFAPKTTVGLKPGSYMRHPSGGLHYDGALDEDVWVIISGYGPTRADVLGGGELFARSK